MISGTAQPGFESVKALFEDNLKHYFEDNAQLCVYVNDECVVDLWGSASGDAHFDGDSLINIFSSGKSLESIAMAFSSPSVLVLTSAPCRPCRRPSAACP